MMSTQKNLAEIKKDYKEFISNIPSYLNQMKSMLQVEELTFDNDEVNKFIDYYGKNWEANASTPGFDNPFKAYLGELLIRRFTGKWELMDHPSAVDYGEPAIVECPTDKDWISIAPSDHLEAIKDVRIYQQT